MKNKRGYTLIELMIAVGLFAIIMTLASGAYFLMISINRQVQGIATGINNLSFALETMTRTIRTGTNYSCNSGGDCSGGTGTSFSVKDAISGATMAYTLNSTTHTITQNNVALTDPSVDIEALTFTVSGTQTVAQGDHKQPNVIIIVSGTVTYAAGKTEPFTIETMATMRGTDL